MEKETILKELQFKAVRSSGAGGQHVNKVSSKVILLFNVMNSNGLTATQKDRLLLKLDHRLTKDHLLILKCDEARSQHKNRSLAVTRFFDVVQKALRVPKKRKPTKPSKAVNEKRLQSKKQHAQKKADRNFKRW